MRHALVAAVTLTALLLSGCGKDSNAFAFNSLAKAGQGEPILIGQDMQPGDGVRMTITTNGKTSISGPMDQTVPIGMTMVMQLQCVDVTDKGDRHIDLKLEDIQLQASGIKMDEAATAGFSGRLVIDRKGRVQSIDIESKDTMVKQQLEAMLSGSGFSTFLPVPPEGLRVGEAIDASTVFPKDLFQNAMRSQLPGVELDPKIEGEFVLKGVRVLEDQEAAEFAINMVMNVAGTVTKRGASAEIDMGMKFTGSQFVSTRSGFPIGRSVAEVVMRATIEPGSGDPMEMKMQMKVAVVCESL